MQFDSNTVFVLINCWYWTWGDWISLSKNYGQKVVTPFCVRARIAMIFFSYFVLFIWIRFLFYPVYFQFLFLFQWIWCKFGIIFATSTWVQFQHIQLISFLLHDHPLLFFLFNFFCFCRVPILLMFHYNIPTCLPNYFR